MYLSILILISFSVALMKPIEPMPGKKTVPLYMIPEDSLLVNPNNNLLRSKVFINKTHLYVDDIKP